MSKQENIEEAIKYFEDMKKGVFPVNGNWLFDMAIEAFESCNETLSILDCAKKIKEHCTNAKWCFDCELGNGDGTCKLADNEYCYSLPTEWKLEEGKDD